MTLSKANTNEITAYLREIVDIRVITPSTPKIEKGFTLPNGLVFNRKQ